MLYAEVIQIYRDKNRIIGYCIKNIANNETKNVTSEQLKSVIKAHKLTLTNYRLTSDNRLVKSKNTAISFQSDIYLLMNKNTVVAEFDLDIGIIQTYGQLPIGIESIQSWIEKRSRFSCATNVKEFFKSIGIKNTKDFIEIIHCVSLHDSFWVKRQADKTQWENVSPFRHNYSKVISAYALEGTILGIHEKNYFSPVIGTDGSFPHTWEYKNGKIKFIKAGSKYTLGGSNSGREPYSEYYAAIIAKEIGFNCVNYTIRNHTRHDGKLDVVTECNCFTTEDIGAVTADKLGLTSYEQVFDFCEKLSTADIAHFADMLFLDCLLLNTDRHFGNIEFLVNNNTQQVIKMAPIFDNNYALLPRFIEELDTFDRSEYNARDGRTFDELYQLVKRYKTYNAELIKLKKLKLEHPISVSITDKRLNFLNHILQQQIDYLLNN